MEPLFAEAKAWHGLRRFRLRGLEKVNSEALLIAVGQHLKRLLSRYRTVDRAVDRELPRRSRDRGAVETGEGCDFEPCPDYC